MSIKILFELLDSYIDNDNVADEVLDLRGKRAVFTGVLDMPPGRALVVCRERIGSHLSKNNYERD